MAFESGNVRSETGNVWVDGTGGWEEACDAVDDVADLAAGRHPRECLPLSSTTDVTKMIDPIEPYLAGLAVGDKLISIEDLARGAGLPLLCVM